MKKIIVFSAFVTCFSLQQVVSAPSVWSSVGGKANDIGVGANGTVWKIGIKPQGNYGYDISKWTGNSWQTISGGAVRIDVDPQGNPWVVNKQGAIWKYANNQWKRIDGTAKDIGIGANGTVWKIGTNPKGNYGYGVYKFVLPNSWQAISGGAERIDVDPQGNPWVVNRQGAIWRNINGQWGGVSGRAKDIGIGGNGTVWKIGTTPSGNYGYRISKWNGSNWATPVDGAAAQISVDPAGKAWVANRQKRIYRMP